MVNHDTGVSDASADPRPQLAADVSERGQWGSLGFVREEAGELQSNWSPLEFVGAVDDRRHAMAGRVGGLYALDVVRHLRRFPDNPDRLVDVIGEIVAAGRWTAVEIGFVSALAEYIADGRIWVTGLDVVDLRPAA